MPLVSGVNHLQVSAFNQAGTESLRQNFEVVLEQNAPQRHVVIVSIGVTNYQDGRYSLTYPAKDAGDFGLWHQRCGRTNWSGRLLYCKMGPPVTKIS